jgi:hypothetical protein
MTEVKEESENQRPGKALVSSPVCHRNAAASVIKSFCEASLNYSKFL